VSAICAKADIAADAIVELSIKPFAKHLLQNIWPNGRLSAPSESIIPLYSNKANDQRYVR
jgi:hypothetical protein